ncbi:histidine kinase [Cellulomonas chengniuliangii]|uniref:Histidine kinase n=1 Tax=Cellulomonas chengniuliangii TaxID=2968084 RepID=A0ABY5KYM9_9CELL|nr:histidine kinase [Cellulomonas chengniuliangii]MCC2307620.1 histidine kinase [Cellulomonas chengniuliangii]UUI75612.1 histidine kinase [Cellulomonas chengniuliangii]
MSDQKPQQDQPQTPTPAEPEHADAVPTEAELQRVATPATVRRAPKVSVFMTLGALLGILIALVLVQVTASGGARGSDGAGFISLFDGLGSVRFLVGLALGVFGAFAGGAVAVVLDRRSARKR